MRSKLRLFSFCIIFVFTLNISNVLANDLSNKNDFDGDGKTDIAVYREGNRSFPFFQSYWYVLSSQTGQMLTYQFGRSYDLINPADYDGDGKTDLSIYRWVADDAGEAQPNEQWYQFSSNGGVQVDFSSGNGYRISRNYLFDNRAEYAQFRFFNDPGDTPEDPKTWICSHGITIKELGAEGFFFVRTSEPSYTCNGTTSGSPTPGDYDGNGKTDASIYYVDTQNSSNNQFRVWTTPNLVGNYISPNQTFNMDIDKPNPSDYDGDGITDFAGIKVVNNNYLWKIKHSSNGAYSEYYWGLQGDKPLIGDFDGDGKSDLGVFRPSNSTWYIIKSSDNSNYFVQFGLPTDEPIPVLLYAGY
jgi:hypothetical protein